MADTFYCDFNDTSHVARLHAHLRSLRGIQRIEICQYRERRSDKQNSRYWPCIVAPFADWLREQGDTFTNLQAHELLKHKFLRKTFVDTQSGEALDYTQSTTELDTAEFTHYMEDCENWLAEFCGIIVPEEVKA